MGAIEWQVFPTGRRHHPPQPCRGAFAALQDCGSPKICAATLCTHLHATMITCIFGSGCSPASSHFASHGSMFNVWGLLHMDLAVLLWSCSLETARMRARVQQGYASKQKNWEYYSLLLVGSPCANVALHSSMIQTYA